MNKYDFLEILTKASYQKLFIIFLNFRDDVLNPLDPLLYYISVVNVIKIMIINFAVARRQT